MAQTLNTRCCIAGGGPAGMMLGFLLARAGVDVTVLEKHADFLRDFRGDTIHPSTLEIVRELGLLDEFLKLPRPKAPFLMRLIPWLPFLRGIPARVVGVGVRPEHVRTREQTSS
jgi:NADPH-dependent 2,4-dienoyl-CoA reductase/sulfur reductase-like enzyme